MNKATVLAQLYRADPGFLEAELPYFGSLSKKRQTKLSPDLDTESNLYLGVPEA